MLLQNKYCAYRDKDEPGSGVRKRSGVLNAEHTKYVAYCLSKAGAGNDPAVPFTIDDRLDQVCNGGKCKEDCEEISGTNVRTKGPKCFRVGQSCSYSFSTTSFSKLPRLLTVTFGHTA